ncbi:hypothetical protein R1sor_023576 [Riccia sorocarpa]|uniref:Uncharacterized protein n=1 Tax=Riccia sorocarpa TaxID=122646 RepID=A0ABD3GRD3_9MARC
MAPVKVKIFSDFEWALAIAIVKRRRKTAVSKDELHWKEKAKMYKQEFNALRLQIQEFEAEDTLDKLPALGPCDCLFFSAGLERKQIPDVERPYREMSKFSVQLFLRNVRRLNRARQKRRAGSNPVLCSPVPQEVDLASAYNLKEHLPSVLQFVMNILCDAEASSKSKQFSAYVHHSVKFIKDSIQRLTDEGAHNECNVQQMVEALTTGLSLKLLNYSSDKVARLDSGPDSRVWIQYTSYQLGRLPCIGHQFIFTASKLIAEVAESLVCLDPFHEGVTQTYENLYFLFQLLEKLLSDYLCEWAEAKQLNIDILKETLEYHFSTVKFLSQFPNWNSLVVEYSNRLTAEIKTQLDAAGQYMDNHNAEGSQHTALLHLVQMATCGKEMLDVSIVSQGR